MKAASEAQTLQSCSKALKSSADESMRSGAKSPTAAIKKFVVDVNGVQLHLSIAGTGLHTILCIPGVVGPSRWCFSRQLEFFGTEDSGYTVVTFDPRGYGYSRPPDRTYQLTPQHYIKSDAFDAYQLMVALGFRRFSVLGWCDGGMAALAMAHQYPDAVRSVVVWGGRPYLTDDDLQSTEALRDFKKWKPTHYEVVKQVYGIPTLTKLWHNYIDSVKATHSLQLDRVISDDELAGIACPTLVIHGENDTFTKQAHAEYIRDHVPSSQMYILLGSSHSPHMDPVKHSEFNSVVNSFLSYN